MGQSSGPYDFDSDFQPFQSYDFDSDFKPFDSGYGANGDFSTSYGDLGTHFFGPDTYPKMDSGYEPKPNYDYFNPGTRVPGELPYDMPFTGPSTDHFTQGLRDLWSVPEHIFNESDRLGKQGAAQIQKGDYHGAFDTVVSPLTDLFKSPIDLGKALDTAVRNYIPFMASGKAPAEASPEQREQVKQAAIHQAVSITGAPVDKVMEAWHLGDYDRLLGQGIATAGIAGIGHAAGEMFGKSKYEPPPPGPLHGPEPSAGFYPRKSDWFNAQEGTPPPVFDPEWMTHEYDAQGNRINAYGDVKDPRFGQQEFDFHSQQPDLLAGGIYRAPSGRMTKSGPARPTQYGPPVGEVPPQSVPEAPWLEFGGTQPDLFDRSAVSPMWGGTDPLPGVPPPQSNQTLMGQGWNRSPNGGLVRGEAPPPPSQYPALTPTPPPDTTSPMWNGARTSSQPLLTPEVMPQAPQLQAPGRVQPTIETTAQPVDPAAITAPFASEPVVMRATDPVPAAMATDEYIANRLRAGWTIREKTPTHTTFRRMTPAEKALRPGGTSAGMFFDPRALELIKEKLRTMFGREPTDVEVQATAERESRSPLGERGLVAPFDRGFQPHDDQGIYNQPTDPSKLQGFLDKAPWKQDPMVARRNEIENRYQNTGQATDLYRLPDGRIIGVDATATKGVESFPFGREDGPVATYMRPMRAGDRRGPDGYVIESNVEPGPFPGPPVQQPPSVTNEPRFPQMGPMGEGAPRLQVPPEAPGLDVAPLKQRSLFGPTQQEIFKSTTTPDMMERLMGEVRGENDPTAAGAATDLWGQRFIGGERGVEPLAAAAIDREQTIKAADRRRFEGPYKVYQSGDEFLVVDTPPFGENAAAVQASFPTRVEAERAAREMNLTEAVPGSDFSTTPYGQNELPWSKGENRQGETPGLTEAETSRPNVDQMFRGAEEPREQQQSMMGDFQDAEMGKFLHEEGMAGGTQSSRAMTRTEGLTPEVINEPYLSDIVQDIQTLAKRTHRLDEAGRAQNMNQIKDLIRMFQDRIARADPGAAHINHNEVVRVLDFVRNDPNATTTELRAVEALAKITGREIPEVRERMMTDPLERESMDYEDRLVKNAKPVEGQVIDADIAKATEQGLDTPASGSGVTEKIKEVSDKLIDDVIKKKPGGGTNVSMAIDPRALELLVRDLRRFFGRTDPSVNTSSAEILADELNQQLSQERNRGAGEELSPAVVRQWEYDTREVESTRSVQEAQTVLDHWTGEQARARLNPGEGRRTHATRMVQLARKRLTQLQRAPGYEVVNGIDDVVARFDTQNEASDYIRSSPDGSDLYFRVALPTTAPPPTVPFTPTYYEKLKALRDPTGVPNPPVDFGYFKDRPNKGKLNIPEENLNRLEGIANLRSPERMNEARRLLEVEDKWRAENRARTARGEDKLPKPPELDIYNQDYRDPTGRNFDAWGRDRLDEMGNGLPGLTVADNGIEGTGKKVYNLIWRSEKGEPITMAKVYERADGLRTVDNLASDRTKPYLHSKGFKAVIEGLLHMNALEANGLISQFTARAIAGLMKSIRENSGSVGMFTPIKVLTDALGKLAQKGLTRGPDGELSYKIKGVDDAVDLFNTLAGETSDSLRFLTSKATGEKGTNVTMGVDPQLGKLWGDAKEVLGWGSGKRGPDTIQQIKGTRIGQRYQEIKENMGWSQGKKTPSAESDLIDEVLAFSRNATTTADMSAPGRQGLSLILTPQFWRSMTKMFGGISHDGAMRIHEELLDSRIHQKEVNADGSEAPSIGEKMGLTLYEPASEASVGKRAEAVASRWLETGGFLGPEKLGNIPNPLRAIYYHTLGYPIRASNRMYTTFLNTLRTNRAQFLMDRLEDMSLEALDTGRAPREDLLGGVKLPEWMGGANVGFKKNYTGKEALDLNPYKNLDRAKEIADFVNTATGQAPLRMHYLPSKYTELNLESAAGALNRVAFSPGLFMSRARMLNPFTYVMATPFVRRQYLKALFSTAAAWYGFTQMAKLADPSAEIGDDWTSADLGKVRIGNTRMDASGGFAQFLTLMGRAYSGGYTSSATGQFHRFGQGFQAETQRSNVERFMVNKLNPLAKFAYDFLDSTEYKPTHIGDRTLQLFTPLFSQDVMEIYNERPELLPWLAPIAFGVGTQTYSKGESVGKLIAPENDFIYKGGGGMVDWMPQDLIDQLPTEAFNPRMDY